MNTRKIIHFMFILNLILCYFITMPLQQPIQALSINQDFGFEGCSTSTGITNGLPSGSDNIFTSNKRSGSNPFYVISTTVHSGNRSFQCGSGTDGWINATYTKTSYMTHFEAWIKPASQTQSISFYNRTYGDISTSKSMIWLIHFNGEWLYRNSDDVATVFHTGAGNNIWFKVGWYINDTLGNVYYYTNGSDVEATARNPSHIIAGYRIDAIYISGGIDNIYFDDMNWTISTSYDEGETPDGCIDTSGFDEFQNGLDANEHKSFWCGTHDELEFTSYYPVSMKPEVFEFMHVYEPIGNLSDYILYINGINLGNPECFYPYLNTEEFLVYSIQWDISSIPEFNNTVLDFELVSLYADDFGVHWNIYTSWYQDPMSNPFDIVWGSGNLDGEVPDGTGTILSQVQGPCWRIFYSVWNPNPPPVNYTNDLMFIFEETGFKLDDLGQVYMYPFETGRIEYTVDTVDGYYSINITTQANWKKTDIYAYHDYESFIMTTDDFYGQCWANLTFTNNNTVVISKLFSILNLSEKPDYDPDFYVDIWTDPNPSNTNSLYTVGAYINNFTRYDYWYLCRFTDDTTSKSFSYNIDSLYIANVNSNNITTFDVYTRDSGGYETWILFATNDNQLYLPLKEHKHFIRSIFSDAYITTDLSNNKGYTDTPFNIIYFHSYYLSRVAVKWDDSIIKDYTDANQRTSISYSSGVIGNHILSLELWDGSNWTVLKSITIALSKKQDGGGGIFPTVDQPLGSIIGMILTIFCLLSPFMLIMATHSNMSIHPIIYAFTGGLGLSISTVMGLFPVWLPLFVVVCGIIVLVIFYVKGQTSSGE